MADLTKFKAALRDRMYASDRGFAEWNVATTTLETILDAAEVAGRDAVALREQMTAQARHVANLEFEVARLTRLLELQPEPALTTETEEQK